MKRVAIFTLTLVLFSSVNESAAQDTASTPEPAAMAYIAGDAVDLVPLGDLGEVAVAILGPVRSTFGSAYIPVVVRNNTELTVESANVAIVVRDSSDAMIAVTETSSMYPNRIPPGEIAFGEAFLSNTTLPNDASFETLVTSDSEGEGCCVSLMPIVSSTNLGERIVGEVRNDLMEEETFAYVQVLCFQGDLPANSYGGSVVGDDLAPGATGAFQVDMYEPCERYLIAAS